MHILSGDVTAQQERRHAVSWLLIHQHSASPCWHVDTDLKVYLQPELAFCIWSNRYITDLVTMPSSVSPVEHTDLRRFVLAEMVHVGTTADLKGFQTYACVYEILTRPV